MGFSTERETKFHALLSGALGEHLVEDSDYWILVRLVAYLLEVEYGLVEDFHLLRDVDRTPDAFLVYLLQEYGVKLPDGKFGNVRELIKESKPWYSSKGTLPALQFVAAITNTAIGLFQPALLIEKPSTGATLLSGAVSQNGPLPHVQSRIGRLRDGVLWSYYTYILTVQGFQNVPSAVAFLALLELVHPAGSQRFLNTEEYYQLLYTVGALTASEEVTEYWDLLRASVPVYLYEVSLDFSKVLPGYVTASEASINSGFGDFTQYDGYPL